MRVRDRRASRRHVTLRRMSLTFVDLDTAKTATDPVLVTSSLVPSPWSEAAKGLFRLARVPVLVVRRGLDKTAIDAWTGVDNVPALRHGNTVVTESAAILCYLADLFPEAKLAPPPGERGAYYRWLFFTAGCCESALADKAAGWTPDTPKLQGPAQ